MSGIEWTDRSDWNCIRGCTRTSPGCTACYAETMAGRFSNPGFPFHGIAERTSKGARWTGKIEFIEDRLTLPLKWRKPAHIFVNSMYDLFHEDIPDEWIDRVFAVAAMAHQHTMQILTKRSARMRHYMNDPGTRDRVIAQMYKLGAQFGAITWPLPNVWLGVSAEDQQRADERIPDLHATPAAVRFVSLEPLLGPINLRDIKEPAGWDICKGPDDPLETISAFGDEAYAGISWAIVGGESGPNARPFDVAWARSIIAQCKASGAACFVKQVGSRPSSRIEGLWRLRDRKGGDMSEWPEDLRVREMPRARERS